MRCFYSLQCLRKVVMFHRLFQSADETSFYNYLFFKWKYTTVKEICKHNFSIQQILCMTIQKKLIHWFPFKFQLRIMVLSNKLVYCRIFVRFFVWVIKIMENIIHKHNINIKYYKRLVALHRKNVALVSNES